MNYIDYIIFVSILTLTIFVIVKFVKSLWKIVIFAMLGSAVAFYFYAKQTNEIINTTKTIYTNTIVAEDSVIQASYNKVKEGVGLGAKEKTPPSFSSKAWSFVCWGCLEVYKLISCVIVWIFKRGMEGVNGLIGAMIGAVIIGILIGLIVKRAFPEIEDVLKLIRRIIRGLSID